MDQRQQYGIHGYGYPGSGTQRYKGGGLPSEYRPYSQTGSQEVYEHEPMVPPLTYTNEGNCTEGRFPEGEVPNCRSDLPFNRIYYPYFPIGPETFDKDHPNFGNTSLQGIPSGYRSIIWTCQQKLQRSSQECGMSDPTQANAEATLHPGQQDSDPISPHGSNTNWSPLDTPGHMSVSFKRASNAPYPALSHICAKCGNHPHVDDDSVYRPDRREFSLTTDWRLPEVDSHFSRPDEENFLSNRQHFTQESSCIPSLNEHLDASRSEQSKSGISLRFSAAVDAPDYPVTTRAEDKSANRGLPKKRWRKPRAVKPRKPRALTVEGKAHAKAVREFPGGACQYCKRKKTKCTHRLLQDKPTGSQDTPWNEPITPDQDPGHHEPRFYGSSQENDIGYQDIDCYDF